jgi:hypothetical protein
MSHISQNDNLNIIHNFYITIFCISLSHSRNLIRLLIFLKILLLRSSVDKVSYSQFESIAQIYLTLFFLILNIINKIFCWNVRTKANKKKVIYCNAGNTKWKMFIWLMDTKIFAIPSIQYTITEISKSS